MFLEKIDSPEDLRKISLPDLPKLAQEIRDRMVEVVSCKGGHLASSLGAVELAIMLHYCLNTPKDILIWDVGHQAYAHKMLTGRLKSFSSLREFNGISGFPSKDESVYDPFTTGHSSTAVSLALGAAAAIGLNKSDEKVVAVIGDGSLTGGLCFEALNNTGHLKAPIIVVLNTNEMSISPSVGSITTYLNRIISQPIYNRFKAALEDFIKTRMPVTGRRMLKLAGKFEESFKGLIVPGIFFEELGLRYFGPFDGHDLGNLITTFKNIINIQNKEPVLIHVITKKGKGYQPAEGDPVRFHGAACFDLETGEPAVKTDGKVVSYTKIFSDKLLEIAGKDKKIVAITAAMPEGTGLDKFRDKYPDRFFDVGIAEQHAVGFASGLAKGGFKPIVAVYSTFLQRGYDQIIEEIALQDLPVILAIDRAGIVGEDGVTHQGLFDIAYLRSIPNLTIMAPKDAKELESMLEFAISLNSPVAIRYPRSKVPLINWPSQEHDIEIGKPEFIIDKSDIAIISLGSMTEVCFEAAGLLAADNIEVSLINARFVKPLDEATIKNIFKRFKFIFCVEEGVIDGGFGSAVLETSRRFATDSKIDILGLPDEFIKHGRRDFLLDMYGLSAKKIAEHIKVKTFKK